MKKRTLLIAAFSMVLVAGLSVKPAMAYFTDRTEASGMVKVSVGNTPTTPDEGKTEKGSMIKSIIITNTGDYDAYIRVRAVAGSNVNVSLKEGEGWQEKSDAEGSYFEYSDYVAAGDKTSELKLDISVIDETVTNDFNVIIVQEATKVHYDSEGNPYADWTDSYTDQFEVKNEEGSN